MKKLTFVFLCLVVSVALALPVIHSAQQRFYAQGSEQREIQTASDNAACKVVTAGVLKTQTVRTLSKRPVVELPSASRNARAKNVRVSASYISYQNVADLEAASDLVIVATPALDFLSRRQLAAFFPDGHVMWWASEGEVRVHRVIKNALGNNAVVPDSLSVTEPTGLVDFGKNSGVYRMTTEDYVPTVANASYIMFLKRNRLGSYALINLNDGKFNLDGIDTFEQVFLENRSPNGSGKNTQGSVHQRLRSQVLQRYGL